MRNNISYHKRYALAAALGAVGGGMIVVVATKAVPKIMTRIMSGMMRNMMVQMRTDGCDRDEM
jgi:hypothetical protein